MTIQSREIRLRSRPHGTPRADDFELAEVVLPEPADGEIVVRDRFVSVDPYMRGRMNDVKSYVPPFALGKAMEGGAIGEVVASRAPAVPVGALVIIITDLNSHNGVAQARRGALAHGRPHVLVRRLRPDGLAHAIADALATARPAQAAG